jgi:hypothetical protein
MEPQNEARQGDTTQLTTRVFIIWSGNTGKPLSKALKELISDSISELHEKEIFISTEMDKGIPRIRRSLPAKDL